MKTLFDLQPRDCRWPVRDNPRAFCAEPRDTRPLPSGRACPYCAEHRLLAYAPTPVLDIEPKEAAR